MFKQLNKKLEDSNSIYRIQIVNGDRVDLVDVAGGLVQGDLDVNELERFIDEVIESEQSCL